MLKAGADGVLDKSRLSTDLIPAIDGILTPHCFELEVNFVKFTDTPPAYDPNR